MKTGIFDSLNPFLNRKENKPDTGRMLEAREESVSEIKERLKYTLDAAPLLYALIIGGVLVEVNEYARRHIGMEPESKDLQQFFKEPEQINTLIKDSLMGKESSSAEVVLKMKNDEVHRFLVNVAAIDYRQQHAYILWGLDIENRTQRDEAPPNLHKILAPVTKKTASEVEYISAPTANVLLVDDLQSNLSLTAGLLRHCGITADVAMSGKEAINIVREKDYDIILMDHLMPEMDGIEAMRIIREIGEKYQKIPIIALTASPGAESKDFLIKSGMDDFLSKPLDNAELNKMLKKWLKPDKLEPNSSRVTTSQSAAYSDVLQAISLIEGIDVSLALSRISGMQDVLEQTIEQTTKSIIKQLVKMEEYLSHNSFNELAIAAHGMKGTLANIGAMRYSELAAELEIVAKTENIGSCMDEFARFSDTMSDLAANLNNIFACKTTGDLRADDSNNIK